jgi:hypothetical protein
MATVPRVITMISAERMKSVRIAPRILSRSKATRSTAGSATAAVSAARAAASVVADVGLVRDRSVAAGDLA